MKRKYFAMPYLVWLIVLIVAPMILIMLYAFTGQADGAFTLENIRAALNPVYMKVFLRSLELAVISTAICLLLGYPIAYFLSRMSPRRAAILSMLFIVPMWMNFLLRTYAWMNILDTNGLINQMLIALGLGRAKLMNTTGAVIVGMVYNYLPFMILPIYNILQKMPKSNIEAAQDLGGNNLQVFTKVVFPLSLPGVISGITMVLIPTITTFAISRLLGGSQFMLYGDLIENQFLSVGQVNGGWNVGAALSCIMMVLVFICMYITNRIDKGEENGGTLL
ncbi:MAG: ABC transporter permease [Christensenellales bacterium]|jgi:spermidine/putrescine transport system permease protein